jgi:tripartite-type tricarboxylate transporter receptor subunit TctC
VQLTLKPPFTALPLVQDGKDAPLALTESKRSGLLPNVPTIAELGYDKFFAA